MLHRKEMIQAVFMSLALIGILALQTYWFLAAIELKEEEFDRAVATSLSFATAEIRKNAVEELFDPLAVSPTVSAEPAPSGSTTFKKDTLPDGSVFESISTYSNIDSLSRNGKEFWPTDIFGSLFGHMGHMLTKRSVLNAVKADSILQTAIRLYGLPARYEAIVVGPGFQISDTLHGELKTLPLNHSTYEALLFEGSLFSSPQFLVVHFPGKKQVILTQTLPFVVMFLVLCVVILYIYISTLRRLLRQKKLSQMKTDFINNMTHEFKTPIASISLAADSIVNEKIINQPDIIRQYSRIIKEENHRMNRHIESVLQSAVLEAGKLELRREKLLLSELIEFASDRVSFHLQEKQIRFEHSVPENEPYVYADYTHFTNVISNIFENAVKYNNAEPPLIRTSLKLTEDGNHIELRITDNGIGISREKLPFIFDKFMRVSGGDIHNTKGFGLGLFYVRSIVELHKGNIKAESTVNKGTTIIIQLPLKLNEHE